VEHATLTREQVFERLERMGVAYALLDYSGGYDESIVEPARLYAGDPKAAFEPCDLEPPDDEQLAEVLERPIYDHLGEAFGDSVPDVGGTLVWNVGERKVVLEHNWLHWKSEEREV
jgi:hypothetical protein